MAIVLNTGTMKYRENQSDSWHPLIVAAEIESEQNRILYFDNVSCTATTGNFASFSNASITANHVVLECIFNNPGYISSDVTWTTGNGTLTLNGTCRYSTTARIVLGRKDN